MTNDEAMGRALALAQQAAAEGDVPVGAVVLDAEGRVIGEGRNRREDGRRSAGPCRSAGDAAGCSRSPSGMESGRLHAGRDAGAVSDVRGRLPADAYRRIVFGAWDAKLGACGSVWDIPRDPHIGHSPEVIGGVREGECAALLGEFFAGRR